VPNDDAVDCGMLTINASLDARVKAQRCVLDALAADRALKLIDWQQDDQNGRGALIYAWPGPNHLVSVLDYTSNGPTYPLPDLRGAARRADLSNTRSETAGFRWQLCRAEYV